jgi:hypothetical protein
VSVSTIYSIGNNRMMVVFSNGESVRYRKTVSGTLIPPAHMISSKPMLSVGSWEWLVNQ